MFDSAINKVVRLSIAQTQEQFERLLEDQPPGLRLGVKAEIERSRESWRYEKARHCAYYMKRQGRGIMIWRWSYVASEDEAGRLRALITSLHGPLDAHRANRIFEFATRRTVSNPRPLGMEFHALDSRHALDTGAHAVVRVTEVADTPLIVGAPATT